MQLLGEWLDHRDRDAIGELIRRHIEFVLNTARRQVGNDSHLAEDITQAVFILLLQKAHRIKSEGAMAGWLFNTTRFAASNARRMARRREYYERQAAASMLSHQNPVEQEADLESLLNEAIARLPKPDQTCVIMSYLQQKSHREVGAVMGVSEEAARKRIYRAVERMREFVLSRSVAAPAAAIGSSLMKQTVVSAQFIESTINVATLSQAAVQTSSAITLAKGVSKMFFAMKLKAAAAIAVIIFGGAVTAQMVQHAFGRTAAVVVMGQVQAAPALDPSRIELGDGVIFGFMGISRLPETADSWHALDGKSIPRPGVPRGGPPLSISPDAKFFLNARVECRDDVTVNVSVPNATVVFLRRSDVPGQHVFQIGFTPKDDATRIDIRANVADGPWKTTLKFDKSNGAGRDPWQEMNSINTPQGSAIISQAVDRDGNASFFISADRFDGEGRIVAIDINGVPHQATERGGQMVEKFVMAECSFDIPAVMIKSLELQTRTFNKRVTARSVSLDPSNPAKPEIVIESDKNP